MLSADVIRRFITEDQMIIGLGSGSSVAILVKKMAVGLRKKESLEFISSSLQIKIEAENSGLKTVNDANTAKIDVVFDGADQIDSKFCMIKGGGGALLKEKILMSAAKQVVIIADENKFVNRLSRQVPIEVHRFSRLSVYKKLKEDFDARPTLRTSDKGYPFITESGNIIFDTLFDNMSNVKEKEAKLKNIPGVVEVGLFTRPPDIYYKPKEDGSYEIMELDKNPS
jgi:ribose 5-phosphate isomerase A